MSDTSKVPNILVVDDKVENTQLVSELLSIQGYTYYATQNPLEVEEILKEKVFDMVLLDSNMPKRSGLKTLMIIREKFSSLELPVIMVTAQNDDNSVIAALKAGANDYVFKPIKFDILKARIDTHLKLNELNKQSLISKQFETLTNIVVTYNHEINNPLAIALTSTELLEKNIEDSKSTKLLENIKGALFDIRDKVKSIEEIKRSSLEFNEYHGQLKSIKLNNG